MADATLTSNERPPPSDERNGCFLDKMWCCKVCDSEIPDGHTEDCDIWKLEKKHRDFLANEYNAVLVERDQLKAALAERGSIETLPPRIVIMNDGRAMGGSDVCHTCEAHCTVINDLQTGLQKIIRDGDYTAPEGMKRIAREALGLPQDAEPWRNCQMLACKPNRRCMNSDDCNTLKANEGQT